MVASPHKSSFNQRSSFLTAFLLLFFGIIVLKLFSLQVIHGGQARAQADAQHSIYQKLLPSRGEIDLVDSNTLQTTPVAADAKSFLVYAVPSDVINPTLTASSLATVLQMDPKAVLNYIEETDKKYVPIKKQLTDQEQAQITALKLPGIYFDSQDTRIYPENNLLSQVIGFIGYTNTGNLKVGRYGLEKYFEKDLAGTSGSLEAEQDTSGALIFGATNNELPAEDGANLILTVDQTIQFQAQSILKEAVTKNGADSGSLIVANPKTGAILAMANYPDFDPNHYNQVTDPAVFNNEAVTGNYEPGSKMKAITMAAALDENKVTPQTTFVDTGSVKVDNFTIKNALPKQAEKVACGSLTPSSVPATLAV